MNSVIFPPFSNIDSITRLLSSNEKYLAFMQLHDLEPLEKVSESGQGNGVRKLLAIFLII